MEQHKRGGDSHRKESCAVFVNPVLYKIDLFYSFFCYRLKFRLFAQLQPHGPCSVQVLFVDGNISLSISNCLLKLSYLTFILQPNVCYLFNAII